MIWFLKVNLSLQLNQISKSKKNANKKRKVPGNLKTTFKSLRINNQFLLQTKMLNKFTMKYLMKASLKISNSFWVINSIYILLQLTNLAANLKRKTLKLIHSMVLTCQFRKEKNKMTMTEQTWIKYHLMIQMGTWVKEAKGLKNQKRKKTKIKSFSISKKNHKASMK